MTRSAVYVLLVSGVAALALSNEAYRAPPARRHVMPRQEPSPTTSFDYWWPYPSWGAGTTSPAMANATPNLLPATATSMNAAVSPTSESVAPSPISPTGTLPSTSLIQITALPPATKPRQRNRDQPPRPFNIAYLAPLFVVIGAAVGCLSAWISFRLYTRRLERKAREEALQAGPPYVPRPSHAMEDREGEAGIDDHDGTRFLGGSPRRERSARGSAGSKRRSVKNSPNESWLRRALTAHRREPTDVSTRRVVGRDEAVSGADQDSSLMVAEDEPFLGPLSALSQDPSGSTTAAGSSAVSLAHSGSPQFASLFSPYSEDENWENVPYDTLRHKSIRRDILERLKSGQRRRVSHKRTDSDGDIEDRAASGAHNSSTSPTDSMVRANSTRSDAPALDKTPSGPGFRIVVEDPEAGEQPAEARGSGWSWSFPWSTSPSHRNPKTEDKFTTVPSRSLAEKKKDQEASPVPTSRRDDEKSSRADIPRIDSSVLPSSPPQLLSPPLENKLFFGPISPVITVTTPMLGSRGAGGDSKSPRPGVLLDVQSEPERKQRNKLRTQREPPLLPFPSSADYSPNCNRLTKTMALSAPRPDMQEDKSRVRSQTVGDRARTPTRRNAVRYNALDKVEQIVAQSYSQRDLRGEEQPASPTMFGALTISEASPVLSARSSGDWSGEVAAGIEQRLAQLRG